MLLPVEPVCVLDCVLDALPVADPDRLVVPVVGEVVEELDDVSG
jgi:hypothetical protein